MDLKEFNNMLYTFAGENAGKMYYHDFPPAYEMERVLIKQECVRKLDRIQSEEDAVEYYDAFHIGYSESGKLFNTRAPRTIIALSDPRLEIIEKAITEDRIVIDVGKKYWYAYGSPSDLSKMVMKAFTFFYTFGTRDEHEAIKRMKKLFESGVFLNASNVSVFDSHEEALIKYLCGLYKD